MMRHPFLILLVLLLAPIIVSSQNALDSNGLRTGPWKGYYTDSTLRYEGAFIKGNPVGMMKRYNEDGSLAATMEFYRGTNRCRTTMFDGSGRVKAIGVYDRQKKDSTWHYLGTNGTIRMIENYNHGTLSGVTESFYPSGKLSERLHYESGKRNGPWIKFFQDGDTMLVASYKDDMLHGPYTAYYPGDMLQITGKYNRDVKDGDWNYYSEKGELVSVIKYDNGDVLNPEELERKQELFLKQLEESEGTIPEPAQGWQ